uniref:Immunoglobulin domain-containing protein n=1 Tax=Seriola dumerili TaxID=41447 RepID=A0A3B4V674_SERDU
MKTFTLITALLLCSFSWISVSVSQSQTVDVQSGKEVTLQCCNLSSYNSLTFWLRLVNKTNVSCISVLIRSGSKIEYCDGYQSGKFDMSSNISTVFLKIRQVDSSDSGLYFCGFYTSGRPIFSVTFISLKGSDRSDDDVDSNFVLETSDEKPELTSLILGGLTVFLVMVIIGLVVKIRKLQKGIFLTALRLLSKTVRNRRPASEREVETHVVYDATR